ncbi:hypothetical protein BHE74_00028054 [Ensete ventricosum]|nr:hypothetical protein BHE74_00028054 [Ensete ventricosum]
MQSLVLHSVLDVISSYIVAKFVAFDTAIIVSVRAAQQPAHIVVLVAMRWSSDVKKHEQRSTCLNSQPYRLWNPLRNRIVPLTMDSRKRSEKAQEAAAAAAAASASAGGVALANHERDEEDVAAAEGTQPSAGTRSLVQPGDLSPEEEPSPTQDTRPLIRRRGLVAAEETSPSQGTPPPIHRVPEEETSPSQDTRPPIRRRVPVPVEETSPSRGTPPPIRLVPEEDTSPSQDTHPPSHRGGLAPKAETSIHEGTHPPVYHDGRAYPPPAAGETSPSVDSPHRRPRPAVHHRGSPRVPRRPPVCWRWSCFSPLQLANWFLTSSSITHSYILKAIHNSFQRRYARVD